MKNLKIVIFIFLLISPIYVDAMNADSINSSSKIDIYVQHDENNNDIYDLVKNNDGNTIVYKNIYPKFTANKAWTKNGNYIDNVMDASVGATSLNDYVPVKTNERYFVKIYGVGSASDTVKYATILFLNDKNEYVSDSLYGTYSKSKSGVIIKVPSGATKMHITMYNNQNFTLQKEISLSSKAFDNIKIDKNELLNYINSSYVKYKQNPTFYNKLDQAYITFVNDDSRANINTFVDLFISKNIPICLATIPNNLIENTNDSTETRKETLDRAVQAGGEVLAHGTIPITEDNYNDYNVMYSLFVKNKLLLKLYGYDVNGMILAGGTGQINNEETEKWTQAFYKYSDRYGLKSEYSSIGYESVYNYARINLANYESVDEVKATIDNAIQNKKWIIFYWHDLNEVPTIMLEEILDYVNSKSDQIKAVTYKEMYDKSAVTKNELVNKNTTYYVSANGTSTKGLSINDPMSLSEAKEKQFLSGDTILLKGGDIFYDTINFDIAKVDNDITKIGSYGNGKAIISGAKIVSKSEAWELYDEGIYKINLKDISNFRGFKNTDTNSTNIGFIEDYNGNKYASLVNSLEQLINEFDLYSDGTYLYIKTTINPYDKLGELKLVPRINLVNLKSDLLIENLKVNYTGAHAMVNFNSSKVSNLTIQNCIIDNIGGSRLKGTTRYGNGIELYSVDAENIDVKNNIIRNVYDVAFTIQGPSGSGNKVKVHDNIMINNSQDSEIWENGDATGVTNYNFYNNISINQGRGWGYDARDNKYAAASILFWGYLIDNTDISFNNNLFYNPRRIYFVEQTYGTIDLFKKIDKIKSNYNIYYLNEDAKLFRDEGNLDTVNILDDIYNKDSNSLFNKLENSKIKEIANISDSIDDIRNWFKPLLIDKIEIANLPQKLNYIQKKENIDLNDGKVKVFYRILANEIIPLANTTVDNFDNTSLGKIRLSVTYLNKKTTFDVNIIEKQSNETYLNKDSSKEVISKESIKKQTENSEIKSDNSQKNDSNQRSEEKASNKKEKNKIKTEEKIIKSEEKNKKVIGIALATTAISLSLIFIKKIL